MLPSFLRDQRFLSNSFGHFSIDVLNSTIPVILALFSVSLGLSNTEIGLILTVNTFGNSLTQPIFGWLADRYSVRVLGIGGVLWMSLFYGLAAISTGWWSIGFLVLIGIGSAAYHPQGAMNAGRVQARHMATATAVFFLSGQIGLGVGPVVSGSLLQVWGQKSLLLLAGLNLIAALWLWRARAEEHSHQHEAPAASAVNSSRLGVLALILFALLLFTRMSVQNTAVNFLPKHLQDIGWEPASFGLATSMLWIGSAIGGLIGGALADLWGRRMVVAGSLFVAAPLLWLYLTTAGITFFVLLFLIGMLLGAGFSVTIVMAQAMLPGRKALASGLTMGFMFASGSLGAALAGWIADSVGLGLVLRSMAFVSIFAGLCALALPSTRPAPSS